MPETAARFARDPARTTRDLAEVLRFNRLAELVAARLGEARADAHR